MRYCIRSDTDADRRPRARSSFRAPGSWPPSGPGAWRRPPLSGGFRRRRSDRRRAARRDLHHFDPGAEQHAVPYCLELAERKVPDRRSQTAIGSRYHRLDPQCHLTAPVRRGSQADHRRAGGTLPGPAAGPLRDQTLARPGGSVTLTGSFYKVKLSHELSLVVRRGERLIRSPGGQYSPAFPWLPRFGDLDEPP